jgi:lipoprotein-anchoring transpeptidase ErfK/SrfK
MEPLRRALQYVLAMVGVGIVAMVGWAPAGQAALPGPDPDLAVSAISPSTGQVVGVGMPVTVTFTKPIANRTAAEQSITMSVGNNGKVPTGHFTWMSDDVLQFTPDSYWPAHSSISVSAGGFKTDFDSAAATMGVANISAHTFTVSVDGQVVKTMPASMGKPKHPTPVGSFTALEKDKSVVMDSRTIGIPLSDPEGYRLTVADAVRVTWGGVYVHSAPWSVGSQGNANVSHGCINLSPDNAAWYFNTVNIGDPIIVQA